MQHSSTVDLMIRNILLKHAGKYGCRAQTSADTVFAEAELLVRGEFVVCQCFSAPGRLVHC